MNYLHTIALAALLSGCAFKTSDPSGGAPSAADTLATEADEVRPCGRALGADERRAFLESTPLYDAVWAVGTDGSIWHADRAAGTTHRLLGGVDTVIPVGGASVKTSETGRVIVTSFKTNAVYEVVGNTAVKIAGSEAVGHKDGGVDVAKFDMPYGISILADGAIAVHDVGNLAIRRVSNGQVTTLRCTAKD